MKTEAVPFRKVLITLWDEPGIIELGHPGAAHPLYLYIFLMTGPHTTSLPGLSVVGRAATAERLCWESAATESAFSVLEASGRVVADWKTRVVWLPHVLKDNAPGNPNVLKYWVKQLRYVPACDVKDRAVEALEQFLRELDARSERPESKAFTKAFREAFAKEFGKALSKGLGDTVSSEQGAVSSEQSPPPPRPEVKVSKSSAPGPEGPDGYDYDLEAQPGAALKFWACPCEELGASWEAALAEMRTFELDKEERKFSDTLVGYQAVNHEPSGKEKSWMIRAVVKYRAAKEPTKPKPKVTTTSKLGGDSAEMQTALEAIQNAPR